LQPPSQGNTQGTATMQNNRSLLHTLAITIIIAGASISCSGIKMPSQDQASQLNSVHDTFSQFLITDAENDSTSVTFYSCGKEKLTKQQLKNPAAYPEICVNAFKTSHGKPFTVSKKSLQNKENQDFLSQNWKQLEALHQSSLADKEIKHADSGIMEYFFGTTTLIASALIWDSGRLSTKFFVPIAIIAAGVSILGLPHLDKEKSSKSNNMSAMDLNTNTPSLTEDKNIDFDTLSKANHKTHSPNYKYFQNIIELLGSHQNEFQDKVSIDHTFYKNFAKFLKELNLASSHDIVEYCQIVPAKTCNPV